MLRKWQQLKTDGNEKVIIITEVLKLELTKLKLLFLDWNFFLMNFFFFFIKFTNTIVNSKKKKDFVQENDQTANKQTKTFL